MYSDKTISRNIEKYLCSVIEDFTSKVVNTSVRSMRRKHDKFSYNYPILNLIKSAMSFIEAFRACYVRTD